MNHLPLSVQNVDGNPFVFFNSLRPALVWDGDEYKLILRGDQPDVDQKPIRALKLEQVLHYTGICASNERCIQLYFSMPTHSLDWEFAEYLRQKEVRNAEKFKSGSWQDMYFSQPPVLEIRWQAVEGDPDEELEWSDDVGNDERRQTEVLNGTVPAGTKFGDLREEGKRLGW